MTINDAASYAESHIIHAVALLSVLLHHPAARHLIESTLKTREPQMSATTSTAPTVASSITKWSNWAFQAFEKAGAEWTAIKASPAYGVIKGVIIDAVRAEFPQEAGSLVDIDSAVEHTLDALAAASAVVKS